MQRQGRQIALLSIGLWGLGTLAALAQSPALPKLRAVAAVLMEAKTGKILFAKNPDQRLPPASTTKIMTALLLAREVAPEQRIAISPTAAALPGTELGAKPSETFPARDLLYALLLVSANDVSHAVAEQMDGSEAAFAQRMNAEAERLGLPNTRFTNPHGLPDANHFSSARDLANLTRQALRLPTFDAAIRTRTYRMTRPNGTPLELRNTNDLLWTLPGADGVKTGWTSAAGYCFVGSATRQGRRLITVVLNSPNWKADTAALTNFGFKALNAPAPKTPSANASPGNGTPRVGTPGTPAGAEENPTAIPNVPQGNPTLGQPGTSVASPGAGTGAKTNARGGRGAGGGTPSGGTASVGKPGSGGSGWAIPGGEWLDKALRAPDAAEGAPENPAQAQNASGIDPRFGAGKRGKGTWVRFESKPPPPKRTPPWLWWLLLVLLALTALIWAWLRRKTMQPLEYILPFLKRGEQRKEVRSPQRSNAPMESEQPAFTFEPSALARRSAPDWISRTLAEPLLLMEPTVRRHLKALLEIYPEAAYNKVMELVSSPKPKTRLVGAELLAALSPRRAEENLQALIEDSQLPADVRAEAIELLAEQGGDRYESYWLDLLLQEGVTGAARALAALERLDDTTVSALRRFLTAERPRPQGAEAELRLNQLLAHIACILGVHGKIEPREAEPYLKALPQNHRENVLVSDLRGLPSDWAVERLVHCALYGHAYPALTALLDCDPEAARGVLDRIEGDLEGGAKSRALVLRWILLGEGDDALIKKMAEAGDDLASGALQLGQTQRWNAASQSPDALLAAAQIVSLRLGYTDHAKESLATVFRTVSEDNGAQNVLTKHPELTPLAGAYPHSEVRDTVQAALYLPDGTDSLVSALAKRADHPAFQAEMAFWADKTSEKTRLLLTRTLAGAEHPAAVEAIAQRAHDADPAIRSAATRALRAANVQASRKPEPVSEPSSGMLEEEALDQAA